MENNHGFIPDVIKEEDYIFGGLKIPQEVLVENGQWDEFLPDPELQRRNGLETMNCTSYGTLNCLETLFKRLFGKKVDNSERYIGVMAGTTKYGNSPQNIIETIRKKAGLIPEKLLPFNDSIKTWGEYYSPNPMAGQFLWVGQGWLNRYEVRHEWVFRGSDTYKPSKIREALKYSPLGVSVVAWRRNGEYYVKNQGEPDNHWVMLYGYEDGKYWKIFDQYDSTLKKLAWDYDFGFAKRYFLKKKEKIKRSVWQQIIDFIKKLFNL